MRLAKVAGSCLGLVGLAGVPLAACSLAVMAEDRFDYTRYVFEAEVLRPVGPLRSDDWPGEAWGLRLEVKRAVHLPSPRAEYDLVPLDVEPDCSTRTYTGAELERRFAAGETVRVVAVESQLGSEVLRICRACGSSYFETLAESRDSAVEQWGDGVKGLAEGGQVTDDFEFQVVLLGLEAAASSEERAPLLLALAPYLGWDLWLEVILRRHPVEPEVVEEIRRRGREGHEAE